MRASGTGSYPRFGAGARCAADFAPARVEVEVAVAVGVATVAVATAVDMVVARVRVAMVVLGTSRVAAVGTARVSVGTARVSVGTARTDIYKKRYFLQTVSTKQRYFVQTVPTNCGTSSKPYPSFGLERQTEFSLRF